MGFSAFAGRGRRSRPSVVRLDRLAGRLDLLPRHWPGRFLGMAGRLGLPLVAALSSLALPSALAEDFKPQIVIPENSKEMLRRAENGPFDENRNLKPIVSARDFMDMKLVVEYVRRQGPREGQKELDPRCYLKPTIYVDMIFKNYSDKKYALLKFIKLQYLSRVGRAPVCDGDNCVEEKITQLIGTNVIPPAKDGKPGVLIFPISVGKFVKFNQYPYAAYYEMHLGDFNTGVCYRLCSLDTVLSKGRIQWVEDDIVKKSCYVPPKKEPQ